VLASESSTVISSEREAIADPERLATLADTGLMEAESAATLDRFARLARAALSVPVALVSLVDERRQRFVGAEGLPEPVATERETPLSHSFCRHVVADGDALIIGDATRHPRVRANPAVEELKVIAYAGIPIRSTEGHVLGSFCTIDHEAREWSARELAILRDLAAGVSREIELLRRLRRAERAEQRMAQANEALSDTQADSARETRSTLHDLATPLSILTMGVDALLKNRALGGLPEVQRTVSIMNRNCAHAAAILDAQRELPSPGSREVREVAVAELVREVVQDLSTGGGPTLRTEVQDGLSLWLSPTELRRCLENLVSNGRRFARSEVKVRVRADEESVELAVEDDGPGLPDADAYREAFDAGVRFHEADGRSRTGLGLYIVRELVHRQGGTVRAEPAPAGGARFVIVLPRGERGADG
jgi:signal transduction histidine kinase